MTKDLFGGTTSRSTIRTLATGGKTLAEAKAEVRAGARDGTTCPCCGQFVKVYKRPLYAGMAAGLVLLCRDYVRGNQDWIHVPSAKWRVEAGRGGDFAKLRYWGLIEERPNDDEAKRTSGFWRPTDRGLEFANGRGMVQKYALVFQGECVGFDGHKINIGAALAGKFNYTELMEG